MLSDFLKKPNRAQKILTPTTVMLYLVQCSPAGLESPKDLDILGREVSVLDWHFERKHQHVKQKLFLVIKSLPYLIFPLQDSIF